jgi:hypothetical protein
VTGAVPLLRARVGPAIAWCSGRASGNVGAHLGDDPRRVARNRQAVASAAGLPVPEEWVWLRQVHGADVHVAARGAATAGVPEPEADAAVTAARGLPLAVVTADCAPLVLANEAAVAVVHAGHRGLALGVVETAVGEVRAHGSGTVHAFLGPCIRPERYEFGRADLADLVARFGGEVESRTLDGAPAFDLPAAVRVALRRAGVDALADCGICTAGSREHFSYRRDGATGRQVTVAVLP